MKISHECPLDLLEDSKEFNDYEYSLLHLMDIPAYKEFYKEQAKHRYQILDNSAFEYQFMYEGFNVDYFVDIINEVMPSSIIIPDVISDCDSTINNFTNFPFGNIKYNPEIIGVIQGSTEEELLRCAEFMIEKADKLAIVFHSPAYQINPNLSKDENNCIGRFNFVQKVKQMTSKPLHLLGCSLPREFSQYSPGVIETIDTANPVQFGLMGTNYNTYGISGHICDIDVKPNYLMNHVNMGKATLNNALIMHNINVFKNSIQRNMYA